MRGLPYRARRRSVGRRRELADALRRRDDVGLETVAVRDVPDVYVFVLDQAGRLHQVRVDRAAAFVMKLGLGDAGAVDLAFQKSRVKSHAERLMFQL